MKIESGDNSRITLFEEGSFLKAYERSAYALVRLCGDKGRSLLPSRRHVAKLDRDVVSVGFPKSALGKWERDLGLEPAGTEGTVRFYRNPLGAEETEDGFAGWKESLPVRERRRAGSDGKEGDVRGDVLFLLRNYNLGTHTPVECMCFLNELQGMLGDGKEGE